MVPMKNFYRHSQYLECCIFTRKIKTAHVNRCFHDKITLWKEHSTLAWVTESTLLPYNKLTPWIRVTEQLKAESHIACRAHAVLLPCRVAKGLYCVFPIWFTQCGCVWFTLAMPCSDHTVLLKATAQQGRWKTVCGLPARVRLLPATTQSSTKIVIRYIPILLTPIHTYDCKEW